MWDVFISYSRQDWDTQKTITKALQENGLQVWTDVNLAPGTANWESEIGTAIENSNCVLVLMTPASKNSEWVAREINFARTHQRKLIPVLVKGEEQDAISFGLAGYQYIDLRINVGDGLAAVVAAVQRQRDPHAPHQPPKPQEPLRHPSYRLSRLEVRETPDRLYIRMAGGGSEKYVSMLIKAFPDLQFSEPKPDYYRVFDWEVRLSIGEDRSSAERVQKLLKLFQEVILIDDFLDPTFALDSHVVEAEGREEPHVRTTFAEWIDVAKLNFDPELVLKLATALESFILNNPTYANSDLLIPIPTVKPFNLTTLIVDQMCADLKIPNGNGLVHIAARINWEQRPRSSQAILHGNYEIPEPAKVEGKRITVIDDVYLSGTHMNELGHTLKQVGARVQGLVLTRR